MQQALGIALYAADGEYTKDEIREVFEGLISAEQTEIELAWIDGNRVGWAMESDWPEHGTLYFKQRFKILAPT